MATASVTVQVIWSLELARGLDALIDYISSYAQA